METLFRCLRGVMASGLLPVILLSSAVGILAGCGGAAPISLPKPQQRPEALPKVENLELRSLLLLLADRRLYEPLTVERAFDGDAELRRELAVVLGRIQERAGIPTLQALLLDDSPEVRREAAFALGLLGVDTARPQLLRVATGEDRAAAVLAVEALAASGVSVLDVGEALAVLETESGLGQEEVWHRLLPVLHRFSGEPAVALARLGLEQAPNAELRGWAVYALAQDPQPRVAADLRPLLADEDPWIRGLAAQALGRIGDGPDLERLAPQLQDPDPWVVIQALEAGRRLVASARAAAVPSWREALARLVVDPRPGVRMTAIETSAYWLLDELLEAPLLAYLEPGEAGEAGEADAEGWAGDRALVALAVGGHERSPDLIRAAAAATRVERRVAAVRAAAVAASGAGVLDTLAEDPEPAVRRAVLEERLAALARNGWTETDLDRGEALARGALEDVDASLWATACDWLTEIPALPVADLAVAAVRTTRVLEARLSAVRALAARGAALEEETEDAATVLQALARDSNWLVRRQAARALVELGRTPPPVGPVASGRGVDSYEDVILRTRRPRRVELVTSRGSLVLELDCPAAPMTCLSFLQLADQGFFDGLAWHRLVPGFAVQSGDPRGDGWGGPGYRLRDEVNRRSFRRGTVGMALSGPDTAGSQFFITLSRQPQLDGVYTALGEVVDGEELLGLLEPGDRVESVRPVP
ncbi:MAG: peptidylprolyl isomerase [Acidobacteriota bacterium]|nr:peptidylprolyl isomerase [Acidobacteriota bacterium]